MKILKAETFLTATGKIIGQLLQRQHRLHKVNKISEWEQSAEFIQVSGSGLDQLAQTTEKKKTPETDTKLSFRQTHVIQDKKTDVTSGLWQY